jgi:hypothetical protein
VRPSWPPTLCHTCFLLNLGRQALYAASWLLNLLSTLQSFVLLDTLHLIYLAARLYHLLAGIPKPLLGHCKVSQAMRPSWRPSLRHTCLLLSLCCQALYAASWLLNLVPTLQSFALQGTPHLAYPVARLSLCLQASPSCCCAIA